MSGELAEADLSVRGLTADETRTGVVEVDVQHLRAWVAEYDERGRERDAARAEAHKIGLALGLRPVERIRLDGDAVHDRALGVVAELERLREELRQADEFGRGEFRVTQHAYDQAVRTIGDLRARDEAAKALARWWNGLGGCSQAVLRDPRRGFRAGADALDALARAHKEAP